MAVKPIVALSKNFRFTDDHLEAAKQLNKKEAYPELFGEFLPEGLEFVDFILMETDSISRSSAQINSQFVRHGGGNDRYPDHLHDLTRNGWRLNGRPISVVEEDNGSYTLLDGRTKDSILELPTLKVRNRIVALYKYTTKDTSVRSFATLTFGLNANKENGPSGTVKLDDIISVGKKLVAEGSLSFNRDVVQSWVKVVGADFTPSKIELMTSLIFDHSAYSARTGLEPKEWKFGNVDSWMKQNKYIETNTVIYFPVSYSNISKAIFEAAKKSLMNPTKEVRVVVHTGLLSGASLEATFIKRVLDFKEEWYEKLNYVSTGFFDGKSISDFKIKLYGVVPANLEELCPDDGKLIVFGKNDQNITRQYVTNKSLNTKFFEEDEEDEEEEV
jgi:hypothetical protein